jgi:hypothetical protein
VEKARQHPALTALALGVALAGACAVPAAGQALVLPSGLEVERIEVIWDEDMMLGRFRYLAPEIAARGFDLGTLRPDMDALCRTVALPETRAARPDWDEVVISFSSVAIPFGEADPEVVQSFEGYRLQGEGCIWTQF